ncbi:hypothetical protein NXS19_010429 [Fusarium pseudograminearum]|nr:hypothetical protein NXS19_010429 [Fusarium pseudograminearum]
MKLIVRQGKLLSRHWKIPSTLRQLIAAIIRLLLCRDLSCIFPQSRAYHALSNPRNLALAGPSGLTPSNPPHPPSLPSSVLLHKVVAELSRTSTSTDFTPFALCTVPASYYNCNKLASCSRSTVSPARRQTQRAATLLDSAVTISSPKPITTLPAWLLTALPLQPQINVLSNAKKVKDQSTCSKWRRGQNSAEPSAFVESHSHLRVYTPTASTTTPSPSLHSYALGPI